MDRSVRFIQVKIEVIDDDLTIKITRTTKSNSKNMNKLMRTITWKYERKTLFGSGGVGGNVFFYKDEDICAVGRWCRPFFMYGVVVANIKSS